jgi:hypothetical protein
LSHHDLTQADRAILTNLIELCKYSDIFLQRRVPNIAGG